jgi:tRNA(Glu) U13 pseudouridine synthase TruD
MERYKLKQIPEDFIVKEHTKEDLQDEGEYLIFRMRKQNYTTENAVQELARALKIERKKIGYAGSKDSKAHTWQDISIKGISKERIPNLKLKDIELEFKGRRKQPLSLGDLDGNHFEIVVRNITKKPLPDKKMLNLFGEQRFQTNNAEVGLAIIKKDFKKTVDLISEASKQDKEIFQEHLEKNKNDYVGALKKIPWKNLTMYIHAYQSKLWNEAVKEYISQSTPEEDESFPIIGFSTEVEDERKKELYERALSRDKITQNDFVIRAIPDLTCSGSERKIFAEIKHLHVGELEEDDLNPGMKKCKITFSLGKGSYATQAIATIFEESLSFNKIFIKKKKTGSKRE